MASSQDKVQHYLGQLDREVCTKIMITRAACPPAPSWTWPSDFLLSWRQLRGHFATITD
jgi:hypothetical protein